MEYGMRRRSSLVSSLFVSAVSADFDCYVCPETRRFRSHREDGLLSPMTTVDSPGPARYVLPNSVGGKQPLGKMLDPPVWTFGRDKRAEPKLTIASPGPIYRPDDVFLGPGPHGIGPEYSLRPSHRAPREQRATKIAENPGPIYMVPTCLGVQWESTKRSFGAGKISQCPRKTMDPGPDRSPGPAAYDRTSLGLKTQTGAKRGEKPPHIKSGMGSAERFFNKETRTGTVPGPGAYKIPTCIGGTAPDIHMKPVFPFNKDDARHVHSSRIFSPDPCSPGPHARYKIATAFGAQALGRRPSSAAFGFGTASRWQASPEENREHRVALTAVLKKKKRADAELSVIDEF
jgi:hypothetical protein